MPVGDIIGSNGILKVLIGRMASCNVQPLVSKKQEEVQASIIDYHFQE